MWHKVLYYPFCTHNSNECFNIHFYFIQFMFGETVCCVCDTHSTPAVSTSIELCQTDWRLLHCDSEHRYFECFHFCGVWYVSLGTLLLIILKLYVQCTIYYFAQYTIPMCDLAIYMAACILSFVLVHFVHPNIQISPLVILQYLFNHRVA